MGRGKHFIGDFLPPDELEKFMETFKALKVSGAFPGISSAMGLSSRQPPHTWESGPLLREASVRGGHCPCGEFANNSSAAHFRNISQGFRKFCFQWSQSRCRVQAKHFSGRSPHGLGFSE